MEVEANLSNVPLPSPSSYTRSGSGVTNSAAALSHAESLVHSSKKLEYDLLSLGKNIKHTEENIKHLKTYISTLDDHIIHMQLQVTLGKTHSSAAADTPPIQEHHPTSAASIVCHLNNNNTSNVDPTSSTNDVIGVVATLGKLNDDTLSRILSEYLGLDTMLALVCMTYNGVGALETYDEQGSVSKSSGLHGLSASLGRPIDGRFNVICLENLRPYVGEFVPDDPQKRLALLKPKFPNGESPQGFLGFAVNMIHLDNAYLVSVTSDGHGLRETLFYNLFSRLQVYKTRAHMLQALPFLSHGAVSLDGGLVRSNGVIVFGTRDDMKVKFATNSSVPDNLVDIEKQIKEFKQKKEIMAEELELEEAILTRVKYTLEVKKQEFVRFMVQSSPYVTQYPV